MPNEEGSEGSMTVHGRQHAGETLVSSEAFETLAPEWGSLHGRCLPAPPFGHPAWQEVWLRHFGTAPGPQGRAPEPVYLAFRVDGELVGVIPVDVSGPQLSFLGDPNICDYAPALIAQGREPGVADALIEWLMEDLSGGFTAWGLGGDSAFRDALLLAAEAHGWKTGEEEEAVCPRADIRAGFEAFVASLGKHDRHELRRKLRNLEAAGVVTLASASEPAEAAIAVDQLIRMMRVSREDKDEFLTPTMEAFFRDLAERFAGLGLARLSTLELDGQATAAVFCFEDADTTYLYNSGFEPEYAHQAVGLLSKAYTMREAAGRGLRQFDFLRGDEDYKRRLGGVPRPVVRMTLSAG